MVPHADMLLTIALTAALLLFVQRLAAVADRVWLEKLGWRPLLATTGWLGVPVHELSHALACVLMRRKIRELRLLAPDRTTGVLGYVAWEPGAGPLGWMTELVVGWAPLLGTLAAMLGLAWAEQGTWPLHAVDAPTLQAGLADLGSVAWAHVGEGGWTRTATLLRLFAMVAIAAHGVPSVADLSGTWRGALVVATLAAAAWGIGRLVGWPVGTQLLLAATRVCAAVLPALLLALTAVTVRGLFAWAWPRRS